MPTRCGSTRDSPGPGRGGRPTFADGRIYSLGGKGNLNCLDAATGKLLWTHDLVAEAGAVVPQWGFAVSPLVVDGKVIVFAPGKDAQGLLAYDAATGELKWKLPGGGDTYSSPQLVELGGVRQVLMHDNRALRAVSVDDGKLLWEYVVGDEMAVPMLQPQVVAADQLLVSAAPGLTLLEVKHDDDKWTTAEKWVSNRIKPNFNDFVTHEGKIYGLDDGILCASIWRPASGSGRKGAMGMARWCCLRIKTRCWCSVHGAKCACGDRRRRAGRARQVRGDRGQDVEPSGAGRQSAVCAKWRGNRLLRAAGEKLTRSPERIKA